MTKHIVWIDRGHFMLESVRMDIKHRFGSKINYIPTSDMALDDLMDISYDLVVINFWNYFNQPDLGYSRYLGEDDVNRINKNEMILKTNLMRKLKTEDGPNKNTPVIAMYPSQPMELIDKLKQTIVLKQAGADELFDYNCMTTFKYSFLETIQKYLK